MPKRKGKKRDNVFFDNRGFPDPIDNYDWLMEKTVGNILRKRKHPAPIIADPLFNNKYDEAKHGAYLREHLKTGHLQPDIAAELIS